MSNVPVREAAGGEAPSAWLEGRRPQASARLRLFCLPYAGGSALVFRAWPEQLPPGIEVCPIQLPGRGRRLRETPFVDACALAQAIAAAIAPYLDRPFAIFGHSMGALLAFELARALRARGLPEPVMLFVAGRRAPHLIDETAPRYDLPEPAFRAAVRALNGAPAEVFDDEELMTLMMPVLRADFELVQRYRYAPGPPLACPIRAFGGVADRAVTRETLEAWEQHTSAASCVSLLPGDHFFIQTAWRPLQYRLAVDLRDWLV